MTRFPTTTSLVLCLLLAQAVAPPARADALKCQTTINKEYGKYLKIRAKTVQKCQDSAVRNASPASPTDCPTTEDDAKLAALEQKLRDRIAARCGGEDGVCDGSGDEDLAAIGWNLGTCPDLNAEGCTNPIVTCDDIATCVACIADEAVSNAGGIAYDQLDELEFATGSGLNGCQRTLGKETGRYFQIRARLLAKCWGKVAKGVAGYTDPPGCPATDAKLVARLERAERKKTAKICRACGATGDADQDGLCDDPGSGFTAAEIGFEPDCPDLVVPSSARACDQPGVTTLDEIIGCVGCVGEFMSDCGGEAVVPASTAHSPACNGGP